MHHITSGVVANIYLAERMASAEREPITGVWGRAPSGVQGQSPWWGSGGEAPLKLKRFYVLDMQWKQQTCLKTLCILETE